MAEAKDAPVKTVKITLHNDVSINRHKFHAGQNVEVPENYAAELQRLDSVYLKYQADLNIKRNFEAAAGTIAVGSGAE